MNQLCGSSYLLQDVAPVRLVGALGSATARPGPGMVRLSFTQEPGVLTVTHDESGWRLVIKWDLALRLMALLHVLILQNMLLRDEAPKVRVAPDRSRVFTVTEGQRASSIVCSWNEAADDVECNLVEGTADELELTLKEGAAAELIMALAERIALNGTASARRDASLK